MESGFFAWLGFEFFSSAVISSLAAAFAILELAGWFDLWSNGKNNKPRKKGELSFFISHFHGWVNAVETTVFKEKKTIFHATEPKMQPFSDFIDQVKTRKTELINR